MDSGGQVMGLILLLEYDFPEYLKTYCWLLTADWVPGGIFKQTQGPTGDETGWKFPLLVGQAIAD